MSIYSHAASMLRIRRRATALSRVVATVASSHSPSVALTHVEAYFPLPVIMQVPCRGLRDRPASRPALSPRTSSFSFAVVLNASITPDLAGLLSGHGHNISPSFLLVSSLCVVAARWVASSEPFRSWSYEQGVLFCLFTFTIDYHERCRSSLLILVISHLGTSVGFTSLLLLVPRSLSRIWHAIWRLPYSRNVAASAWDHRGFVDRYQTQSWEKTQGSTLSWPEAVSPPNMLLIPSTRQMFHLRMASMSLYYLSLWTTAATFATAATSSLPNDATNVIPACALDCFRSFVSNNYDCGSSPSLPCLCQKTGTSGFTLGEGAAQCLVAETARNSCKGDDASRESGLGIKVQFSLLM